MEERTAPPFEMLRFMMFDRNRGRTLFLMEIGAEATYSLHVEAGSAANPTVSFTRTVPQAAAQSLKDALGQAGVFAWDDAPLSQKVPDIVKWELNLVFKRDVYSVVAQGAQAVPEHFDDVLEALYKLDFPRLEEPFATHDSALAGFTLGAFDFSQFSKLLPEGGLDGYPLEEMQKALKLLQDDPVRFQSMMRDEFRAMPPEQRNNIIDALAATGMASREWWQRFLGGEV